MAKIRNDEVVIAALELLDEVGLDALTTRRVAERLGIKSATLYWHFQDKAALLSAMAAAVIRRHHVVEAPRHPEEWLEWFAENTHSFRRALLAHRDGARLHAGTTPDLIAWSQVAPKIAYLVRAGFPEHEATMALLTAGQFTIGCVMEEQAREELARQEARQAEASEENGPVVSQMPTDSPRVNNPGGEAAFNFGLGLFLEGLRYRLAGGSPPR